jgi:hypothetical protein
MRHPLVTCTLLLLLLLLLERAVLSASVNCIEY